MRHMVTAALMLNLGVASVYAQQVPVTFSGSSRPSTVVLQNGVNTSEYNFAGNGMLGAFTFHTLSASAPSQEPTSGCTLSGSVVAGGGVFRFEDGSLLIVNSAEGTDCIQVTATSLIAHCTRIFKISGGTGRFKDVPPGGTVTLDETLVPVVPTNNFFAITGTGTVSGVAIEEDFREAGR